MPERLPQLHPDQVIAAIDQELNHQSTPERNAIHRPPMASCVINPIELQSSAAAKTERADPPFQCQERYHLNDFLRYHDKAFVTNAYRGVLRRYPDQVGLDGYLRVLRNAERSRIEILGRLRYSPEGRRKQVRVTGLLLRFLLHSAYHLPIVGYCLRLLAAILALPNLAFERQRFETQVWRQIHQLQEELTRRESDPTPQYRLQSPEPPER